MFGSKDGGVWATKVTPDMVTPAMLREHAQFTEHGYYFGKRSGYDVDEIDDFLDVVADRLEQLLERLNALEHGLDSGQLVKHWPDKGEPAADRYQEIGVSYDDPSPIGRGGAGL